MTESTLIYDVETACPVHNEGEEILQGITYAKGWGDFRGMGIACVCVLDLMEQRFRVFDGRSLHLFQKLVRERETVVGWNNQTFDDRLLAAHGITIGTDKSFDLMLTYPHRVKLIDAAAANGVTISKSIPGALAPVYWQQGRYGEVIDYCLGDVLITYQLYKVYREKGSLVDPYAR